MGCAQSRVDKAASVARCKDRRNVIKEAVVASKAFSAGHFAYAFALKQTGAALGYYSHGEESDQSLDHVLDHHHDESHDHDRIVDPIQNLPPTPPLFPIFYPSPIKRAISLPDMAKSTHSPLRNEKEQSLLRTPEAPEVALKSMSWDKTVENIARLNLDGREMSKARQDQNNHHLQFNKEEEEEDVVVAEAMKKFKGKAKIEQCPITAKISKTSSVNLIKILHEIDDRFLEASECAKEVSKMLETTQLHYHSNFVDNRGYLDHSARIMQVITWKKSYRGIANGESGKYDDGLDEHETHATVLEKLLAWEKKLYEEVKQGEVMKIKYQKKVCLLNKLKKRGASIETVEKTKAAVSHMHTRSIVDMQSMESTVSQVNRLRDEHLYPRLVSLVEGMAKMWKNMCIHHDTQLQIVGELKHLEISTVRKETTKEHHHLTRQLCTILEEWRVQFNRLVTHQKQYINSLNSWLKLNLIPIESNLKEKVAYRHRPQPPPIQTLLRSWHDRLAKLPDEVAKSAFSSFVAVFKTILLHQEEEVKLKERCEKTRREFIRKKQGFEEWYQKKHLQNRGPTEDASSREHTAKRRIVVETLKKRLQDEEEAHKRQCVQGREKSLNSLKISLPEIFRELSNYAHACSDSYENLRIISQSQKDNVYS